jgi:hypothetical protein
MIHSNIEFIEFIGFIEFVGLLGLISNWVNKLLSNVALA